MPNAPIQENNELVLYAWDNMDISHQNVFLYTGSNRENQRDSLFAKISEGGVFPDAAVLKAFNYSFVKENKVRVPYLITQIHNYNYLRYKNTAVDGSLVASGLHRIYCFITDMKYINNSTTEITFEIDYWTTYQPFVSFKDGYIERTHVPKSSDTPGNWLAPEPFKTDFTIVREEKYDTLYTDSMPQLILECSSFYPDGGGGQLTPATIEMAYKSGVDSQGHYVPPLNPYAYTGTHIYYVQLNPNNITGIEEGLEMFRQTLENHPDWADAIVQIHYGYRVSVELSSLNTDPDLYALNSTNLVTPYEFQYDGKTHIPVNNKLFTYPYLFAEASTPQLKKEYAFELSTQKAADGRRAIYWKHAANFFGISEVIGVPMFYSGNQFDFNNAIRLSDFPQVSCTSDAYKQYLNQNGVKNMLSYIGGALAIGGGIAATVASAGSAAPAAIPIIAGGATALGGVSTIANTAESERIAKETPGNIHGTTSPNILWNSHQFCIRYKTRQILPEQAEMIDNYFTRYGYNFGKIASVSTYMACRSRYNYIKTKNYHVGGSYFVPAAARRYIESLFDRGITLWHDFSGVGNYGANN